MKRKLTALVWAGAMLALALVSVPAAGQEKPVMKTGVVENVPAQDMQLRADGEWTPDSAVVYSPGGEKQTKHVYLPGESYGQYTWENGAWKRSDGEPETWLFRDAKYNRSRYNVQHVKVSYRIYNDMLQYFFPYTGGNSSYFYFPASATFTPEFDTNENLTSFKITSDVYGWRYEFTATYNAGNKPVSIEGWRSSGNNREQFFKAHYAYNDYGYATLLDSYEWNYENESWANSNKETAEYDAQGKILSRKLYKYGEISGRESYEYYDENRFSSLSWLYANNSYKNEWKYGTDGNPGAYYYYSGSELALEYYAIFYPNTLTPSAVEPVPERVATRVWSSGGQLYIAAASAGTAQVYTVAGQLMATVALAAGETVVTSLPPGVYIVAAEGRTWKAVIR